MELMLVMMIISVVLALAAPSLRGFFAGRQCAEAAQNVLSLTKYARSQAVSRGQVCRVNFDAQGRTYWLTVQQTGAFVQVNSDVGRRFELPDGISARLRAGDSVAAQRQTISGRVAMARPAGSTAAGAAGHGAASPNYVQFYPSGRSDVMTIEIRGQDDAYQLSCPSATESFAISSISPGGAS